MAIDGNCAEQPESVARQSQVSVVFPNIQYKLMVLSDAIDELLAEFGFAHLDKKFDQIVEKAVSILDAELCTLWLRKNNFISIKTSFGKKNGFKKTVKIDKKKRLPIRRGKGSGLHGYIAATKEIHNLWGEKLWAHPALASRGDDFLPSEKSFSTLSYPLLDESNDLLGLLVAYNKLDANGKPYIDRGFSDEIDVPLMKVIASKVILAIKNDKLWGQLRKYKLIVENTPDPVIITSRHGKITYANKGALEILGNVIGKLAVHSYYSDDYTSGHEKAKEIVKLLISSPTGSIKNVETILKAPDGSPIRVSMSANLIQDERGKVIGSIGILKDLRQIYSLIDINTVIQSSHEEKTILQEISDFCLANLSKSTRVYIKIYHPELNSLCFHALATHNPEETLPSEPSPIDRGLTGEAFQTKMHRISGDVNREPEGKFYHIFPNVKSELAVPINRIHPGAKDDLPHGVIAVDSDQPHAFSEGQVYFLYTLANLAATALENTQVILNQQHIINQLSALHYVQDVITRTTKRDDILQCAVDVVVEKLNFDYAQISRVKRSEGMIGTVKVRNMPEEFINQAWHSLDSNDIQAWVARNKKHVILDGWDERLDKTLYERYHHERLIRIYLPIIYRDQCYATLETGYDKSHRYTITEQEVKSLQKIVSLIGLGIEQSYLIEAREFLLEQLKAINEASIYIQSLRTEKEVVHHIFRSLERIGYNKGMLSLINEATGNIEGRYALGTNWLKIKQETKRPISGNDILAKVCRMRAPILSKDCRHDPSCNQPAIRRARIKSQYVIPLIANDKPIGTLQIDLTDKQGLVHGPQDVFDRQKEVLETFANQIGVAIQNARDRERIDRLETTLSETAHEIRGPLHNILSQIGGLQEYFPQPQNAEDEIAEIFKIITEEADRAKRQMDNTLIISNKSQSALGYHFEKGRIQNIIVTSAKHYRMRTLERGISIAIRDSVMKLPSFKFDRVKMEQVVNNLLDNAVKYSHSNRLIQIQGYDDGTSIHIDFWNKGQGIPPEEIDRIFEGFQRSDVKDKKRYIPGTGLGLKICKSIVEGHGGRITVSSKPFFNDPNRIRDYDGYDTIFTVTLPKEPKEKKSHGENSVH